MAEKTNVKNENIGVEEATKETAMVTPEIKVKWYRQPKVQKIGKNILKGVSYVGAFIGGFVVKAIIDGRKDSTEQYESEDYTVEYNENPEQGNE